MTSIQSVLATTALLVCVPAFAASTSITVPLPDTPPRVTEAAARSTALRAVPDGKIQSAELENEKGVQVWSFDIERRGTRTITEILVDAGTGKIVSKTHESPAAQAKEAAAEKRLP